MMCDAVLGVGAETQDGFVECLLSVGSGLVGFLLDRGKSGGGVGDPVGMCLSQENSNHILGSLSGHDGIRATGWRPPRGLRGRWRRPGCEALDLAFPGVARSCLSAGWVVPTRDVGVIDQQEVPLLDRLGESAGEEDQDCLKEGGDYVTRSWRSWVGRLPGGRRPPSEAGSGEGPAGRPPSDRVRGYGIWTDPFHDSRSRQRNGR